MKYFNYDETDDSIVIISIKDKFNIPTDITIPSYYKGKQVYLPESCIGLFSDCKKLKVLDLSNILDTSNVVSMQYMFNGCLNLVSLNLSNFNTLNVTSMAYMFYNCKKLQTLDLSSFSTFGVTDMSGMFYNCRSLEALDLGNFNTFNLQRTPYMFAGCQNLKHLNMPKFDKPLIPSVHGMFKGCMQLKETGNPGLNELLIIERYKKLGKIKKALSSLSKEDRLAILSEFDEDISTSPY